MRNFNRVCRELSRRLVGRHLAGLAVGLLAAGCASDPRPVVVGQPLKLPGLNDYCAVAQKEIASARVPARNSCSTPMSSTPGRA
jgi:hypothetical protein